MNWESQDSLCDSFDTVCVDQNCFNYVTFCFLATWRGCGFLKVRSKG